MANIGFDSTVIAWALAHNTEQAQTFVDEQKKFREDVKDSFDKTKEALEKAGWAPSDPDAKPPKLVSEDEIPGGKVTVDVDKNGQTSGDFMGDMDKGLKLGLGKTTINGVEDDYYITFTIDYNVRARDDTGLPFLELIGENVGLVSCQYLQASSNWFVNRWNYETGHGAIVDRWMIDTAAGNQRKIGARWYQNLGSPYPEEWFINYFYFAVPDGKYDGMQQQINSQTDLEPYAWLGRVKFIKNF